MRVRRRILMQEVEGTPRVVSFSGTGYSRIVILYHRSHCIVSLRSFRRASESHNCGELGCTTAIVDDVSTTIPRYLTSLHYLSHAKMSQAPHENIDVSNLGHNTGIVLYHVALLSSF